MQLFYHFTKDIAQKLILLINEQANSYDNLLKKANPFFRKWKGKISEASSIVENIELFPKDSSPQDVALEMETAGAQYFDYIYGLEAIKVSRVVLCGSLIQMARQTLSIAHRQSSPKDQPPGRSIGRQHLRDVVRHGRNHCMHFEEDQPHKHTIDFLKQLEQDFGNSFPYSKKPKESLAIELIAILGWTSHETYAKDIKSLLPARAAGLTGKRTSRA